MMVIKCKMCGGDIELSADRTYGTCDSCGSTVTLPKINDEQRAAAFNRGEHFRRLGEFDKALAVYERIVQEDDTDAEAHWCCALCRFGIEYVKDPATREYLPTCHRASFDSFLEDVDYLAAVEHSEGMTRRQYQKDAEKIAEVQRDILATSQNEKPFDVFICYKESDENGQRTRDSMLAQDIYYQLTEQGLRVFFARITLEDKPGTQYEPYIFAALNSAKVMVVVGTRPEYVNAVWVKNEWSRFLALMRRDHTKLLIPCYRDMDPYDLPEQLSVLQAYDMGKIGFIQDLIRGVMKVLGRDKKPAPAVETVVGQQSEGNANVTALLKRGSMALEDGNWADADGYFDRVLDMDAECAQAYMGKFLASRQCKSLEPIFQKYLEQFASVETTRETAVDMDYHRVNAMVAKIISPESARILEELKSRIFVTAFQKQLRQLFTSIDRTYPSLLTGSEELARQGKMIFDSDRQLSRAMQFAKGAYRDELQQTFAKFAAELDAQVEEARRADEASIARVRETYAEKLDKAEQQAMVMWDNVLESVYEEARQRMDSSDVETVTLAPPQFDALAVLNYKDSAEKAQTCRKKVWKMTRAQKRKKITLCAIGAVLVVAAILAWVYLTQIAPKNHYETGEALLEQGNNMAALGAFQSAGSYRDARERCLQLLPEITTRKTIVQVKNNRTIALKADGTVVATGDMMDNFSRWRNIIAISASDVYITAALTSYGTVVVEDDIFPWEYDVSGWRDIVAVAAGQQHIVGLKPNGTVVATGNNRQGKCNVSKWRNIVAIDAATFQTVGLRSDGTVVATGSNDDGLCDVAAWQNIIAVAAGYQHTVGLKSDGTVVATGDNEKGQCDVSDWRDIVAIAAGTWHTVGLKADGTVVIAGDRYGEQDVSGWTDIVAIAADYQTIGLKADGRLVTTSEDKDNKQVVSGWTDIKLP